MTFDVPTNSARGALALLAIRGVGPVTVQRLTDRFPSLDSILNAPDPDLELRVSGNVHAQLRQPATFERALEQADQILEQARRSEVKVLDATDPDYPDLLRTIPDRPPVLYVKGSLRGGPRNVACVGARYPSRFGAEVTKRITTVLADAGWSIVSGLALGVDALAHQAALDRKAHTVAVLANGLDTVYPHANAKLAEDILASGGALVSEQPFASPASARTLVQRDRIQSGMSAATIVMQTRIAGGAMHTARFTLMQGRRLFAPVPSKSHAADEQNRGTHALVHNSANELAEMIGATGEYAELLRSTFGMRPVAIGLSNKEDYATLLDTLEKAARLLVDATHTFPRRHNRRAKATRPSPFPNGPR